MDLHKRKHKKYLQHTLNCNEKLKKYKGVWRTATQNEAHSGIESRDHGRNQVSCDQLLRISWSQLADRD